MRSKSKKPEEKAIFYDIFIKPKENKIKEIRTKRDEQKGINEKESSKNDHPKLFIANKLHDFQDKSHDKDKLGNIKSPEKTALNSSILTETNNLDIGSPGYKNRQLQNPLSQTNKSKNESIDIMKLNISAFFKSDSVEQGDVLSGFLQDKFTPNRNKIDAVTKKNFFNQLIQIRPPEGINAVVASPLIDSKGWAPSIPSMQINKMKTNLGDLMMRAKGGIQAGDIPKEAHMAFHLGIMNEEEKRYEEALKFYKKYFLSAKLLQDIYGTELALNRIAVLYSNIIDYEQSLYYNEKHKDINTHNINGFVAYYNSGICQRIIGKIDASIKSFTKALQMAGEENVFF